MQPILSMHTWLSLNPEVRRRFRLAFNLPRTAHMEVVDGRVQSDGTTPEDFKHLTIEKMQEYLKSTETDFNKLFDLVVRKIGKEILGEPIEEIVTEAPAPKTARKKIKNANTQTNEEETK